MAKITSETPGAYLTKDETLKRHRSAIPYGKLWIGVLTQKPVDTYPKGRSYRVGSVYHKECEVCGRWFEFKRSTAKTCNAECRMWLHRGNTPAYVQLEARKRLWNHRKTAEKRDHNGETSSLAQDRRSTWKALVEQGTEIGNPNCPPDDFLL